NEETKAQNAKPRRGDMCITDGEAQRNRRLNAGIACSDRANEIEPRPNGGCVKSTPVTTEVVIARSAATWQSLTINAFLVRDCFATLAMPALFGRFYVFSHSLSKGLIHVFPKYHIIL
ncbi:MAG: hypothetical protein LBG80_01185, partial [Bacteroidales bacterium]|nr:hypothetical protein [Bacteroidales bacterium]